MNRIILDNRDKDLAQCFEMTKFHFGATSKRGRTIDCDTFTQKDTFAVKTAEVSYQNP